MVAVLAVSARILGPSGWIVLENPAGGYELEAGSFAEKSTTQRKTSATGEWVEGAYAVRSTRDNITEPLSVWVSGATHFELDSRIMAVTEALDQINYPVEITFGNLRETWSCDPADYVIETSQPFRFALTALVKANVPHRPGVVKVQV